MTAGWVLYVLFVGTLLAGAASAVDGAVRRGARATRWLWAAAMVAAVAFAIAAPRDDAPLTLPRAAVPAATAATTTPSVATAANAGDVLHALRAAVTAAIARGVAAFDDDVVRRWRVPLAILWGFATLAIVMLLVAAHRRVDRARRGWPVERLHDTPVRVAPGVGPAVVGLSRPEIVVPRWLLARTSEEQRLVVVHEREHVAAGDQLLLTGGWLFVALLPWHPAAWYMLARLRLAIELDCDSRVLRSGVAARPYGTLLIDIAGQYAGLRLGALALADRTTHLERRLLAMKPTRSRFGIARAASLAAVAAVLVVAACESRLPTAAEVATLDAAKIEADAVQSKLIAERAPRQYIVDDVVTTAAVAKAIAADRIATINVIRGDGKTPDQISIRTNAATSKAKAEAEAEAEAIEWTSRPGEPARSAPIRKVDGTGALKEPFRGLIVIDDVISTAADMKALDSQRIESVEVFKGGAANKWSADPAAQYGIVKITTKKHAR